MANFYGKNRDTDFAASKLMSFGKSFSRMNGQPLDESEVWYNKADLEAFAAGNSAYVGMKLVYVDEANQKVYQYSVQYDGTVKEIGTSPIGDEATISVDAEGKVSLYGIEELEFTREVEGENGETTTVEVKYQPLLVDGILTWVEPSATTVEGLATEIEGLKAQIAILNGKIGAASKPAVGEEGAEGYEPAVAATGVYVAIEAEEARAKAAEKALDDAIKAIDFVDNDDLADAIKDFTTKDYVDTELLKKVDVTTYAIDKKALEDEDAAIREIAEEAKELIQNFLTGTDTDEVVNKLKEIQDELAKLGDVVDLEAALALKADLEYVNTELAKKANIETTYTKTEVDDLVNVKANSADVYTKDEVDIILNGINGDGEGGYITSEMFSNTMQTLNESLYDSETGHIPVAEKEIDELQEAVANIEIELDKKIENATIAHAVTADAEAGIEAIPEGVTKEGTTLKIVVDAPTRAETIKMIADKVADVTGGESAADVKLSLEAEITRSTTKDDAHDQALAKLNGEATVVGSVAEAKARADKGVADAATAQTAANTNASNIEALTGRMTTAEGKVNENGAAITALDGRVTANETAIATINNTSLPAKADKSVVDGLSTTVGEHAAALSNLNANTIPALQAAIDGKAAATDLTTEVNRATAKENELAGLIATISGDYLKTADKTALEGAITTAVAAEAEIARAAEKKNANDIAAINTLLNTVDSEDSITSLKELAIWVEAHGSEASEMTKAIEKNAEDIAANTKKIGEVEASIPGALSTALAAYKVKDVDGTTLQLSDAGVASVKAVSTDLLVQGELELILNGGKAN